MIPCPSNPEEMAEELYMRRLSPEDASSFLAHLESCHECREIYEESIHVIRLIRAAAKQFRFETAGNPN